MDDTADGNLPPNFYRRLPQQLIDEDWEEFLRPLDMQSMLDVRQQPDRLVFLKDVHSAPTIGSEETAAEALESLISKDWVIAAKELGGKPMPSALNGGRENDCCGSDMSSQPEQMCEKS